ncbi:MAG: hypothetical protein PHE82_01260 [Syntrophomonadaceae bacterium]|nr:hypothetical protein [Syntrophomonadaceae bacterium]
MIKGAKVAEPAELLMIDLQLFAEGEGGSGATVGGDAGSSPSTVTSSIIPGDDYASGGPEPLENQPAELVDFEGFNFNEPPVDGDPKAEPEPTPEPNPVPEPVKKEQSPEANSAFAEIRREAEQAKKQLAERDAWVAQNFGATHGISTWEQYQTAIEHTHRQQQVARQQELQQRPQQVYQQTYQQLVEQGYDQQVADRLASNEANNVAHALEVQAMKDKLTMLERQEQDKAQREQQIRQQQQEQEAIQQLTQAILADHSKLREEYGDLVPADLSKLDQPTVDRLQRGYTLYDAWFLSNRTKITEQTQKAAAQKTLNNLNSKSHLKTEGDGAGDSNASAIPLPPDTLQMYMDSGMTEKQARAFHKKLYG